MRFPVRDIIENIMIIMILTFCAPFPYKIYQISFSLELAYLEKWTKVTVNIIRTYPYVEDEFILETQRGIKCTQKRYFTNND